MADDKKIILSMVGVSKAFQANKQVLKDIYLSFFYGAKIGIIGLNGSGKSTLMKIIAGLEKSYQGEVVCKAQSQTMGTEFITEMVMEAVTAAKDAGVTLYCGEFGVIDQAPVEDTLRWFTDVDTVFRQFGIGCAVWTYKEMDFGLIGEHYAPIREQLLKLWNRK